MNTTRTYHISTKTNACGFFQFDALNAIDTYLIYFIDINFRMRPPIRIKLVPSSLNMLDLCINHQYIILSHDHHTYTLAPCVTTTCSATLLVYICDQSGQPVCNIPIHLYDYTDNTTLTLSSSTTGYCYFSSLPCCHAFQLYTTHDGLMQHSNLFYTTTCSPYCMTFTLHFLSPSTMIAGTVYDYLSNIPLAQVEVILSQQKTDGTVIPLLRTHSNTHGDFMLSAVPKGDYILKTHTVGYSPKLYAFTVDTSHTLKQLTLHLDKAYHSASCIYGFISELDGTPIPHADVILYKVATNAPLTPIDFTQTNVDGMYLFSQLEPGDYLIKANKLYPHDL